MTCARQSETLFMAAQSALTSSMPQRVKRVFLQRHYQVTYPGIISLNISINSRYSRSRLILTLLGVESNQCIKRNGFLKSLHQRFSPLDFVYFPVLYKSAKDPGLHLKRVLFVSCVIKRQCRNRPQFGDLEREKGRE